MNRNDWAFIGGHWLASRLLVAFAMLLVVPHLPAATGAGSPAGYGAWDGGWYLQIASQGYTYAPDGHQHAVAFFPFYPLLIRLLASFGLPSLLAGALVSHAALLVALVLLHAWARERFDSAVARWAVMLLAWCPYSLFASVIYSEALFLALCAGALWAFDRGQYVPAAICGALASATRVLGIGLVPGLLWAAWLDRRPAAAYLAAGLMGTGLCAYMAFLGLEFGDPLAFAHAQVAWRSATDPTWWMLLARPDTHAGWAKLLMVFGGLTLLVRQREELPAAAVGFGTAALLIVLAAGTTISTDRYAYGVLPLALALALPLAHRARWGYAVLVPCGGLLVAYAVRFAQGLWVA